MGKAWFGLIMMVSVSSLPELFVGISSASIIKSADFAVGDVLGSCAFNLAILSLLDIFSKKNLVFYCCKKPGAGWGIRHRSVCFYWHRLLPYDIKLID
jgi:hypothetical protein